VNKKNDCDQVERKTDSDQKRFKDLAAARSSYFLADTLAKTINEKIIINKICSDVPTIVWIGFWSLLILNI
jgi:hypothetical protein